MNVSFDQKILWNLVDLGKLAPPIRERNNMRSKKCHMAIIKVPKHKTISNIKSSLIDWIANQMRHTTTEMLFRVYSRFVPNMTRQDGSAFERMLLQSVTTNTSTEAAAS